MKIKRRPRFIWEGKEPINIREFGGTPPLLDVSHAMDVSCCPIRNVPSVPRTFCPIYVELHRNQVGTSWMSRGLAPRPSPGYFRGIPATKFLYVFFNFRIFAINQNCMTVTLHNCPWTTLIFCSLPFLKKARNTTKKTRIFLFMPNP